MAREASDGNLGQGAARQRERRRGPSGVVAVIVAFAVLALATIIAAFALTRLRDEAAATVAGAVDRATQETARQPTR